MPIYEYRCIQCGERFEIRQAMGEGNSQVNCPMCRSGNPQKLLSTFFSTGSSEPSDIGFPTSCPTGTCGLPPM